MDDILSDIFNQFEVNETSYGEPQAFIDAANDRSIEIVKEMEGLAPSEYYYSCRLHCNEKEFENDMFHSTCGVIDSFCTNSLLKAELMNVVELAIKSSKIA